MRCSDTVEDLGAHVSDVRSMLGDIQGNSLAALSNVHLAMSDSANDVNRVHCLAVISGAMEVGLVLDCPYSAPDPEFQIAKVIGTTGLLGHIDNYFNPRHSG